MARNTRRSLLKAALLAPLGILTAASAANSASIERLFVSKRERRLFLIGPNDRILKSFQVALGKRPGPKLHEGDKRTPEGVYVIDGRIPNSNFHRALAISYPNEQDRARARDLGLHPGSDIVIHGLPQGRGRLLIKHPEEDWTEGCIAVTDREIEEIYAAVPVGTPIVIEG
jgi:murein L,D-transpeptidase YafK